MKFSQSWWFALHTGTEQQVSLCKGGNSLQWRAAWDGWDGSELVNPNIDMRVGQKTDLKVQCQCCQSGPGIRAQGGCAGVTALISQGSWFWHHCRSCLCGFANLTQLRQTERFCFACTLIIHNQKSSSTGYWRSFSPRVLPENCFARQLLHFHFVAFAGLSLEME